MSHSTPRTLAVLGTGGTIACTRNAQGDLTPTRTIDEVVAQSGLNTHEDLTVVTRDVMALDSSAITLEDIDTLMSAVHDALTADYAHPLAGIILIHGTDTMEETAMVVHELLPNSPVPIVLTGAQRPFDDPHPDGPINIATAAEAILSLPAGHTFAPHIAFGGDLLPACGTTKTHTHSDQGFSYEGPSAPPARPEPVPATSPPADFPAPPPLTGLRVEIIEAYAGASGLLIDATFSSTPAIDGLVISALGSGNIPGAMMDALAAATVPVMICSRVPHGDVDFIYGGTGGGAALGRAGMLSGGYLRPSQARMRLLCEAARQRANGTDRR